jgi:hypothetical protein
MLNKKARKVLKRLRRNFTGRGSKLLNNHFQRLVCPIHYERTASFVVDLSSGFCHCYGCGYHGHLNAFANQFPEFLARDGFEKSRRRFSMRWKLPFDNDNHFNFEEDGIPF